MAKQQSDQINKSEELRKYLRKHPEAGAATIIPEFAKQDIEITTSLVSWVKQDMKKKGLLPAGKPKSVKKAAPQKQAAKKTSPSKKSPATKPSQKTGTTTSPKNGSPKPAILTVEDLREAKKLVDDLGGIEQARRALKYLEELS